MTDNKDYEEFISLIQTKLIKKRKDKVNLNNNSNYPSFKETERNFEALLDSQKRNEISKDFLNTFSSNKFITEMQKQKKIYDQSNIQNIYKHVDNFYFSNAKENFNNPKFKQTAEYLKSAIDNYANTHLKEYEQNGILTIDGKITNNPSEYIKSIDTSSFKKEKLYTLEDLEAVLKLR